MFHILREAGAEGKCLIKAHLLSNLGHLGVGWITAVHCNGAGALLMNIISCFQIPLGDYLNLKNRF